MFSEQLARSAVQNLFTEGEISSVCVHVCVFLCNPREFNWCKHRQEERDGYTLICVCVHVHFLCLHMHIYSFALLLLSPFSPSLCLLFSSPFVPYTSSSIYFSPLLLYLLFSLFFLTVSLLLFPLLPLCSSLVYFSSSLCPLCTLSSSLISPLLPRERGLS